MRLFRSFALIGLLFLSTACNTITPTPLLMGRMDDLNTEVVTLYTACSEGASYAPKKEGCDPELLETRTVELLNVSREFISADVKQPQGYDIHLHISMIYFRIGERNENDYSQAAKIARQFFEVQKSISGESIMIARFYFAHFTTSYGAYLYHYNKRELPFIKEDMELASTEGTIALPNIEGSRFVMLMQDLEVLETLLRSI